MGGESRAGRERGGVRVFVAVVAEKEKLSLEKNTKNTSLKQDLPGVRSRGVREVKSWQIIFCNFDSFHVNFERACAARRESESERRERVCEKQEREREFHFFFLSLSPAKTSERRRKNSVTMALQSFSFLSEWTTLLFSLGCCALHLSWTLLEKRRRGALNSSWFSFGHAKVDDGGTLARSWARKHRLFLSSQSHTRSLLRPNLSAKHKRYKIKTPSAFFGRKRDRERQEDAGRML